MRKTATGALWLQHYVDKNNPSTILVLAKQNYFAHIIRPYSSICLFDYMNMFSSINKVPLSWDNDIIWKKSPV